MDQWLRRASQGHEMYYHDLEVMAWARTPAGLYGVGI